MNETRRVRSRRRCVHHFQIYLCACVLCVCVCIDLPKCLFFSVVSSSSGFLFCSLDRDDEHFFVFSSSRGKNSIDPFLCKEEEFIHHTERRRQRRKQRIEDKELKKRRAELFRSRSVSRSLSSSLSKSAKRERERERESGVFFSKET